MRAFKYSTEVDSEGRIKLPRLRLMQGARVEVIILEHEENVLNLLAAAETSLAFWDNPIDDEIWNVA